MPETRLMVDAAERRIHDDFFFAECRGRGLSANATRLATISDNIANSAT